MDRCLPAMDQEPGCYYLNAIGITTILTCNLGYLYCNEPTQLNVSCCSLTSDRFNAVMNRFFSAMTPAAQQCIASALICFIAAWFRNM